MRDHAKNANSRGMTYVQAAAARSRLKSCGYCHHPIPSFTRIVCPPCSLKHGVTGVRGARKRPKDGAR